MATTVMHTTGSTISMATAVNPDMTPIHVGTNPDASEAPSVRPVIVCTRALISSSICRGPWFLSTMCCGASSRLCRSTTSRETGLHFSASVASIGGTHPKMHVLRSIALYSRRGHGTTNVTELPDVGVCHRNHPPAPLFRHRARAHRADSLPAPTLFGRTTGSLIIMGGGTGFACGGIAVNGFAHPAP